MISRTSSRLGFFLCRSRASYSQSCPAQTTSLFASQTIPFFSSSNHQPSSSPSPTDPSHSALKQQLSDQEWEIRTGRAIYVLQETLPDFFTIGLVTSVDKSKLPAIVDGSKSRRRHGSGAVADVVGGVGSFVAGHRLSKPVEADNGEVSKQDQPSGDVEPIYSSKVQLVYTPQGFERSLHIEGAPLYITSSLFVRHTLNALYSDLHVDLLKFRVLTAPSPTSPGTMPTRLKSREKSLSMRIGVTGATRVSGTKSEWEVDCTYTFSPLTGLVLIHTVNSIQPAPHQAVYDAFRLGFGKLGLGFNGSASESGSRGVGGTAPGSICKGHDPVVCEDLRDQSRARRA